MPYALCFAALCLGMATLSPSVSDAQAIGMILEASILASIGIILGVKKD